MNTQRMSSILYSIHHHALELLQDGKYDEALQEFRRTLQGLRGSTESIDLEAVITAAQNDGSAPSPRECVLLEVDDSIVSPHNMFGLFGSAFPLPEISSFDDLVEAVRVVYFNMGLVYHIKGMSTGTTRYLNRAMKMYQIILRVSHKQSKDKVVGNSLLMELAIYSNLGHLHCHFCNAAEARVCRNIICDTLKMISFDKRHPPQQSIVLFLNGTLCSQQLWGPGAA
jgi:hypothetical protein